MPAPLASVVIPAHNEESVIARCLEQLCEAAVSPDLEVVVVANGCTDRTVDVATTYAPRLPGLVVIDEPRAGKITALNRGDEVATTFPRVYLDADVELEPEALPPLLARLDTHEARVAAPTVRFDTSRSSRAVRAYYRVFSRLPYVQNGLVGLGVYAVTEAGRARFGAFPEVTADDLFVQRLFTNAERETSPGSFVVHAPRTLRDLLRVRTRVASGNSALSTDAPAVDDLDHSDSTTGTLRALAALVVRRPTTIADVALYVAVTLLARRRARSATPEWLRDDSSRVTEASRGAVELDGVEFASVDEQGAVSHLTAELAHGRGGVVMTPNVDILRQLQQANNRDLADRADLVVADGMPVVWASKVLGNPLPARVAGASLLWSLSSAMADAGKTIYLLGAAPGVADRAAAALQRSAPGLIVAGCQSPPLGFDEDSRLLDEVVDKVVAAQPDLVFVALGFPRQERVSLVLANRLPSAWFVGCGGALDMAAGDVRRAPRAAQLVGAEWLVRLMQEPRRLARRYIVEDAPYAVGLLVRAGLHRMGRTTR